MFSFRPRSKAEFIKFCKKAGLLAVWFFVIGLIVFLSIFIYLQRTLPDPESIAVRKVKESTQIYDRTGQVLLYDIHGEEKRTIIPWDQIPESIREATLVSEDGDFYNHKGLDVGGIVRAFFKDIQSLSLSQGGSTITQQLVKNALLGQEKTITRKVKEVVLSIEIERKFTKDEIFWMYLNQIPYGSNAYGVQAAARTYFAKDAVDLNNNEAAILTAIIKAPTYYSPYGNHVPELMARKNLILTRMKDLGYISQAEYNEAEEEKVVFQKSKESIVAPHFVIMVKDYLEKKYGSDAVEGGGFKITTTLDANLQALAEEVVTKYSKINKDRYKAKNSALTAINPRTGEVVALVGSRDYFDVANEGNFNVATAKRQPGSAFKPFAYAEAINKGYTDSTILFDLKTEFNPYCSPDSSQRYDRFGLACYHPRNYDGRYRGPVTLRQAIAQSLNLPSVKTLYLAGIEDAADLATKMGITTLDNPHGYGLSLVLGGAEVRLIDLVSAYGVFANDGMRNPWALIQKIESSTGTILEEKEGDPERVLDEQVARMMNDILSDNFARAAVFGYSNSLYIPGRDVAAKTGTTQENRDAWVVGYTPSLVVGVWNGNNKNESMTAAGAGISASGPMWNEFMVKALVNMPQESFPVPNPVTVNKIMLDGNYVFVQDESGTPQVHSILYYVDRSDPLGSFPFNPARDPQFKNWEWSVQSLFSAPIISPSESPPPSPSPNTFIE